MLQQHGHYLAFAFLDQESGEIEYPYIPVAGSQRVAGRHGHVVYASQRGHSIILAAARQLFDPGRASYNAELLPRMLVPLALTATPRIATDGEVAMTVL